MKKATDTMARLLDEVKGIVNQKKRSDMKSTNLLIGALAGLVAGVAIGLLMAPASGSDTRQRLADGAGELGTNLKKRFRKLTGQEVMENESDPWATQNSARNGASSPNWNG